MKVKILKESYSGWHLGHWTNLNGLLGILLSNELKGNPENRLFLAGKVTISCSRLKGLPRWVQNPGWVRIVLDADKLSHNYHLTPFEYWTNPEKARDMKGNFTSERAKGNSEYEIAIVLSDSIQSVELALPDIKKPIGFIKMNMANRSILSVSDRTGNEIAPDGQGFYRFLKVKDVQNKKFKFSLVQAERSWETDLFSDNYSMILNLQIEDEEGNIFIISNNKFESEEVKGIQNIVDYIERIDFPDFMVENGKLINREDIVITVPSNIESSVFSVPNRYFSDILKDKSTNGFNKTRQRKVKHSISSWAKFIKFVNSNLSGKIGSYQVPADWIAFNKNSYDDHYRNFIANYYIDTYNSNISDNPVFCVEINRYSTRKPEYAFLSAVSKSLAIKVILPKFVQNDTDISSVKIIPYSKKHFKNISVSTKLITPEGDISSLYQLIKNNADSLKDVSTELIISGGKHKKISDLVSYQYPEGERGEKMVRGRWTIKKGGISLNI